MEEAAVVEAEVVAVVVGIVVIMEVMMGMELVAMRLVRTTRIGIAAWRNVKILALSS